MNPIAKLSVATALLALPFMASAATISYTGTDAGNSISGTGTSITPALNLPTNIVFTHVYDVNGSGSSIVSTDDWSFTIPAAIFGSSVTGDQLSLTNFNVTGVVDSIALYSGTPGSGTLLASGIPTGSFSSYLLYTLTSAGNYYLAVESTLAPGSLGSYTGTLVAAAPVPLPAAAWLLFGGLGGLGTLARRRKLQIKPDA